MSLNSNSLGVKQMDDEGNGKRMNVDELGYQITNEYP